MEKEHYISFVSYVRFDREFTVKLYPEQGGELRFPQMRGGKMYYYCSVHGLFAFTVWGGWNRCLKGAAYILMWYKEWQNFCTAGENNF